jgi:hypothetical protein
VVTLRLAANDRGSLIDDVEEEEDKNKKKKKKDKKDKKKDDDEDDDDDDAKTKKKKKKGVFRLLHRGKDKAGGVLDGLQYEGDELRRKKAKRQAKRDEREGKTEAGTGAASKKGSVERVVSEGRLGGSSADRRGRTRPGRSRTMSSIPSASTARIICRHCERGEKRRSWGTVREEALANGAPAHRLYEELSEERELISSLLARFDYLVGSVSPDVGDLLIELFTPQLKEDTATEQLRLVMAETREDDDNAKREDDDSDASQPGQGTRLKKTSTTTPSAAKKPKKSRIMGAATTTTTSNSAADKDGPSAKPAMKLSLGKIFGWNNDKSSTSSSTSASSSSEDTESGNGKAKRKVMALLPSCYCPIKKGTHTARARTARACTAIA